MPSDPVTVAAQKSLSAGNGRHPIGMIHECIIQTAPLEWQNANVPGSLSLSSGRRRPLCEVMRL